MFGWAKSKSKEKFTDAKDFAKKATSFDEAKQNLKEIGSMYDTMLKPKKVDNTTVKRKNFTQTVIENKLSEADLDQIYFNYAVSFYVSCLFALVCLVSAVYSAFILAKFMAFLVCFAIFFVCLANMFRFSLNTFKIKSQKFCSVEDWWNSSAFWFPKFKR